MEYRRRSESVRARLAQIRRRLLNHASLPGVEAVEVGLIAEAFSSALEPHEVHGGRTQAIFRELVNSLGCFQYIKDEDQGDWLTSSIDASPPDYLVGDGLGRRLAVEVKNCHKAWGDCSIRVADLGRLARYAELVGHDLKLAIFWSRWRVWTLVDPAAMRSDPEKPTRKYIAFGDAMIQNEMGALGDATVFTRPPIGVRVGVARVPSREVDDKGSVLVKIVSVDIVAGGVVLKSDVERRICLHLLFYGRWSGAGGWAWCTVGEEEFLVLDFEPPPGCDSSIEGYASIGALSSHHTNAILSTLASVEGEDELGEGAGGFGHGSLGELVPKDFDFQGSSLSMIIMHQVPRDPSPKDECAWQQAPVGRTRDKR